MVIATPFAWYIVNEWLEDYAYRIMVPWDVFVISAVISLAIAVFTISVKTVQAAMVNPVKSIKSEG